MSRNLRMLKRYVGSALGGAYCKLTAFSEDLIWLSSHSGAPVKVQIPIASCVALSDVSVAIPCFGTLPGS